MDISLIATAAAAMLAPYLSEAGKAAAKKAGEKAWEKVAGLYQAIRRKFAADKDDYAQKTMERLEAQPTAEARQVALADVLAEKAQTDPAFAQELARLVQGAAEDRAVVQILTQVYGEGRVGKIINVAQASVVQID